MARNFRVILSPLLIICYVCGIRIVEFPAGYPRPWLSCLYDLLLWFTYCFLMIDFMLSYIPYESTWYRIFLMLQILTGFFSLFNNLYYDKKFRNCLRKLSVVDETLKELGITTDFQKLNTKMARFVAEWFAIVLILNFGDNFYWQEAFSVLTAFYVAFLVNYTCYTNLLDELMFAYILGYIGLKFDQVNELLRRLADGEFTNHERRIKRAWENTVMHSHRCRLPIASSSEFIMWIIMHLHLELCKISYEINSVFGIQIIIKMISYFCFIATYFWELFLLLPNDFTSNKKWFYIIWIIVWVLTYLYRLLLINYSCEIVSDKANATKGFINKVMYSTRNAEIREHIVCFLLKIIRAPLRFCGIGFFQLGFKFVYSYCTNIVTLLIVLMQVSRYHYEFLQNYK